MPADNVCRRHRLPQWGRGMAKVYKLPDGRVVKTDPRKSDVIPTAPDRTIKKAGRDIKSRKETFINYAKNGKGVKEACADMGVTLAQYKYLRQSDENFRNTMDKLRLLVADGGDAEENRKSIMPFPEWCEEYLDTKLFDHHLQWFDLLERREPRALHPNQKYVKGDPDFILVNTPPEHAKSTTLTMNYVTYRICEDPNVRVIIVSQTEAMAKRFLRGIKDRLASENRSYQKLQIDFAPQGGFDGDSAAWTATEIYVNAASRDSGEKDPTVQAIGLNGQIYGARADLIILDDCIVGKNAHEFQKQMDWLQGEVYSRLADPGGQILLIGTRMAPVDLYGEIIKSDYYGEDDSPWTVLTQPAVLEYAENTSDWVTLWPWSNRPPVSKKGRSEAVQREDGMWPMWPGEKLNRKRSTMSPRKWALTYQQESMLEDAIFPQKAVTGCVDGMRAAGVMQPGAPGHRPNGMAGLYIIGGFDPAMTGHSAAVVMGVDRMTGERWILDLWTKGNLKPDDIFDKIKELTVKYTINEWRIEKNAMNLMVTQNREIRNFLGSRGCLLKEHFTGANKWDADFGVASMSMLFDGWESKKALIHLPSRSQNEGVKALIEQLTTWEPLPPGVKTKKKTDLVMALWFAEIRARELIGELDNAFHIENSYLSPRDREKMITIDLDYMAQASMDVSTRWVG